MGFANLCLSAGGIRGVAFAGALDELVEQGILVLHEITLFAGTSIGAFTACLLAIGYTTKELLELVSTMRVETLVQPNLATFLYKWGFDDQRRLRSFLESCLAKKGCGPSTTFAALRDERRCNLRVCCSNLTTNRPEYFCADATPDKNVVDGVLMSMALPPLFAPVRCDNCMYIDGAFLDSFPMEGITDPAATLGLRLKWDVAFHLASVEQYFSRLAYVALNFAEKHGAATVSGITLVDIDVGDVSTINFALPRWTIEQLVRGGRAAIRTQFKT